MALLIWTKPNVAEIQLDSIGQDEAVHKSIVTRLLKVLPVKLTLDDLLSWMFNHKDNGTTLTLFFKSYDDLEKVFGHEWDNSRRVLPIPNMIL